MDPANRVVTKLALQELWDNTTNLGLQRGASLGIAEVLASLKAIGPRVALADVGKPLEWLRTPSERKWGFKELSSHLVPPSRRDFRLEEFPGGYAFVATIWEAEGLEPVLLLEKYH